MASENTISLLWKSLVFASSALIPVTSVVFRTSVQSKKQITRKVSNFKNDGSSSPVESPTNLTSVSADSPSIENKAAARNFVVDKISAEKQTGLEEAFFDWLAGGSRQVNLTEVEREDDVYLKPTVSKTSLQQRSRFLIHSLGSATSASSKLLRLDEICAHLLLYPSEKSIMIKEGLLRTVLWMKQSPVNKAVLAKTNSVLSVLGHHDPPEGSGIRILSIDGGGTSKLIFFRGIMAIEILRQLETRANRKVYQLFDYICGVSSGAILSLLLGGLRLSLDECEALYRKLSTEIFNQSPLWGTGSLMWSHAYYDTTTWVTVLKNVFKDRLLIDTVMEEGTPKLAAISAIMNLPSLQAFVFRNYDFPAHVQSQYLGSCSYKMWEAIRASGAAPGYFQEYCLDDYLHQDGGVMINNPTALAIHESRLLWPSEQIQCVVSLGSGRYTPAMKSNFTSTNLKTKILKVIDSATDTEGVHITLHDLLSSHTYFRFNPYLTEFLALDENRPEKLHQLNTDAQMYLRRNELKFDHAVRVLSQRRSNVKKMSDWLHLQKLLFV